jgi:multidrug resistance efflux pump
MTAGAVLAFACRDAKPAAAAGPPRTELKAVIAPFEAVPVIAPIEGRVVQLAFAEGAAVRKGDVLATLSNPAVARDLVYARSAVASAEMRLRTPQAAPRSRPTQSNVERERIAAENVRQKQQRLERMRRLLAERDVSKQDVENAEADLVAAQRELNAERERQVESVAIAPAGSRAMLQGDLDRARADLALHAHRNSLLTIVAPASGTLRNVRVAAGSDVYTRDALADVVDSASARVQAAIAPELLPFVRAGQPVDVRLMTIPARRFREPVARVIQPGSEAGAAIIVNIPNPDRMLQPGTPAVITIP